MSLIKILESDGSIDEKWEKGKALFKQRKILTSAFVEFGTEIANLYIDNMQYGKSKEIINFLRKYDY